MANLGKQSLLCAFLVSLSQCSLPIDDYYSAVSADDARRLESESSDAAVSGDDGASNDVPSSTEQDSSAATDSITAKDSHPTPDTTPLIDASKDSLPTADTKPLEDVKPLDDTTPVSDTKPPPCVCTFCPGMSHKCKSYDPAGCGEFNGPC
ncbi:MAG: hypothetical protein NVSMB1_17150 [Polyangiales bacterium]